MAKLSNLFHIKSLNKYYHYIHNSDYVFSGHRHTDTEMNVILEGSMEITCGSSVFRADAPTMVLLPAGSFHQNRVLGTVRPEMFAIHFEPETAGMLDTLSAYSLTEETTTLFKLFCRDIEKNGQIKKGTCIAINESAQKLFEVFLQYASAEKRSITAQTDEYSAVYHRAVNYMLQNINKSLTVAEVAHTCGVCSTTLKKVFSRYTAMGCMAFFNELKLDKAKNLLLEGKSCAYVSDLLGFSSQAYFSKRFKALFGIAPSKYRGCFH